METYQGEGTKGRLFGVLRGAQRKQGRKTCGHVGTTGRLCGVWKGAQRESCRETNGQEGTKW